jgi:hypothetical protein
MKDPVTTAPPVDRCSDGALSPSQDDARITTNASTELSLVPKLHLGTQLCLGSFACRDAEARAQQRAKRSFEDNFHSQVQLGNEGRAKCNLGTRAGLSRYQRKRRATESAGLMK